MINKCNKCKKILIKPSMYCNSCADKLISSGKVIIVKKNERAGSILHIDKK